MIGLNRRVAGFAALILLAIGLSACGDNEADQRKAFIAFLQTRIVDKSGVHIPRPTADEAKSFGSYAAHYSVITDFIDNPEMAGIGKTIEQVMQKVSIGTVQDFVDHRAEFKTVTDDMRKLRETIDSKQAKTDAARFALKQPDDLKAVYDKVFDRVVDAPVRGFNEVLPIVDEIATASLKLGDYIDANRSKVTMSGKSVGGKDAQTAKDLNVLLQAVTAKGPRFQDAQRRLRITLTGS
jgi:hypothetical protein